MVPSRVFQPLLARIGMIAVVPAAVIWAVAGPVAALIGGAGLLAVELWRIRRAVTSGMPERLEFVPSHPADHPWVDTEGFRRELEALAAVGFHPVADYQVVFPGAPDGLARLLINPAARVYAEVNQTRRGARSTPVATTLISTMSDGWSLQTSSREPMPLTVAFMRTPRAMWRCLPQAPPQDLLRDHLALREEAVRNLQVSVAGDGTLSGFFAIQQIEHQARRAAVLETNLLRGLARGVACERSAPMQWLGDYTGGAPSGERQPQEQAVAAQSEPEGPVDLERVDWVAANGDPARADGPDRVDDRDLAASRDGRPDARRPGAETECRPSDRDPRDDDSRVGVDATDDAVALVHNL